MKFRSSLPVLSLLVCVPAWAQSQGQLAAPPAEADLRNRVVVVENVRFDYAQVLGVEPVFQVLRATRTEQQCEPVLTRTLDPVQVKGEDEEKGRFGRFVESFKGLFKRDDTPEREQVPVVDHGPRGAMLTPDCRIVEVGREFRRPIAYDVDYVYKGIKYRSRLPEDPGRRLKIRVSITPQVHELDEPARP